MVVSEKNGKRLYQKINGAIQMFISLGFLFYHADLFYAYRYIDALYTFMYADWVLTINMILGIFGFIIGLRTLINKAKFKSGYLWIISIILIGVLLDIISVGWK